MKKINIVFLVLLIFGLSAVGFVNAHQFGESKSANDKNGWENHHKSMEEIMESGTYDDFVAYQKEQNFDMPMKIQNQEDFKAMQEHHEKMEKLPEENANGFEHGGMMQGMHGRNSKFDRGHSGGFEGCPMHD